MVTDDLFDLVNAATTATVAGRIFIPETPEDYKYVGPYIVIRTVGDDSMETLAGSAGLNDESFEISFRAKVDDGGNRTCRTLAEAVRLALQAYHSTGIQSCQQESRIDLFDIDRLEHVIPVTWSVMYAEAQA